MGGGKGGERVVLTPHATENNRDSPKTASFASSPAHGMAGKVTLKTRRIKSRRRVSTVSLWSEGGEGGEGMGMMRGGMRKPRLGPRTKQAVGAHTNPLGVPHTPNPAHRLLDGRVPVLVNLRADQEQAQEGGGERDCAGVGRGGGGSADWARTVCNGCGGHAPPLQPHFPCNSLRAPLVVRSTRVASVTRALPNAATPRPIVSCSCGARLELRRSAKQLRASYLWARGPSTRVHRVEGIRARACTRVSVCVCV